FRGNDAGHKFVMPAQAGINRFSINMRDMVDVIVDSRVRGNDVRTYSSCPRRRASIGSVSRREIW
ncbi:MAG TPA: hypothetical protein VGK87_17425, partial [Anaerolineae bacterium]